MKIVILGLKGGKERLGEALSLLPPAFGEEIGAYREEKAVQSAFSALALRKELSRMLCVRPDELELLRTEDGKPYLAGAPAPCFNLSHSGERAVLAFDSRPVGVDLQTMGEVPCRVAARLGANGLQLPAGEVARNAFFRFWTACESVLKWQGCGLKGLSALKLFPCGEFLRAELGGTELPCRVRSFELPPQENRLVPGGALKEGAALSVCSETPDITELAFWEIGDVLGGQSGSSRRGSP